MSKRKEFKITPLHTNAIPYDPLVDHHLEYYFASKNNRQLLVKTKVVNRKNQILDRNLTKMIEHGQLDINNKFRLRKTKPKRYNSRNEKSLDHDAYQLSKTVGKKQFQQFLQVRRNQLKNKTLQLRVSEDVEKENLQDSEEKEIKKDI